MSISRISAALVVSAAAVTLALASAGAASAQGGGHDVRASGTCSAGSTWKMKAKPDDGRLQVELEIDSNRVGQPWNIRLTDKAAVVFSGRRTTTAPSGSFEVRVLAANRAGTDTFAGVAHNVRSGEICRPRIRL
jgi:hypothetical protein